MTQELDTLVRDFACTWRSTDASVTFEHLEQASRPPLVKAVLRTHLAAQCEILLYGAHVLQWRNAQGVEQLYLSSRTAYGDGAAVRGGIPIIFPQFSDMGPMSKHGFARTSAEWRVIDASADERGASVSLQLTANEHTRRVWPAGGDRFSFVYIVRLELDGSRLHTDCTISNTGAAGDAGSFEFQLALHTYFCVPDIATVAVHPFGGAYLDNTSGRDTKHSSEPVRIADEVDRIYPAAPDRLFFTSRNGSSEYEFDGRSLQGITIEKRHLADAVVWNAWEHKTRSIADLESDAYLRYLCIEPGAIVQPVQLAPGQSFTGGQTLVCA